MKPYKISIDLTLRAPIIVQDNGAMSFGLDTAMQRNHEDKPVIPGSLLRGNLRHIWKQFSQLSPDNFTETQIFTETKITEWLGAESTDADADANQPRRARLNFDYWWTTENVSKSHDSEVRYRIKIDTQSGVAETGAFQVIESIWPAGEKVIFKGAIYAWLDDEEEDTLKHWLNRGLTMLDSIGGLKGCGFGKLLGYEYCFNEVKSHKSVGWSKDDEKDIDRIGLRLCFDRPLCIGKPAIGDNNRFDSEVFVPGAAVIAAIMSHVHREKKWSTVKKYIDKVHINHALPVTTTCNSRPITLTLPLSLVWVKDELFDVALQPNPSLIDGQVPAFQPDWKQKTRDEADKLCGTATPAKRLEVRTAIDPDKNTAKQGNLFSMETILTHEHEWITTLDIGLVDEQSRSKLREELCEIFSLGLESIGKTKARATVTLEEAHTYEGENVLNSETTTVLESPIIISLQSTARLLPRGFQAPATNGHEELLQSYQQVWCDLSEGALELKHFFAQQQMYGGSYWWHRFHHGSKTDYHPEILTVAGSVFVLQIVKNKEEAAIQAISEWQRYGLPQLSDVDDNWKNNPWLRQNGYGEIAVNLSLHRDLVWSKPETANDN